MEEEFLCMMSTMVITQLRHTMDLKMEDSLSTSIIQMLTLPN